MNIINLWLYIFLEKVQPRRRPPMINQDRGLLQSFITTSTQPSQSNHFVRRCQILKLIRDSLQSLKQHTVNIIQKQTQILDQMIVQSQLTQEGSQDSNVHDIYHHNPEVNLPNRSQARQAQLKLSKKARTKPKELKRDTISVDLLVKIGGKTKIKQQFNIPFSVKKQERQTKLVRTQSSVSALTQPKKKNQSKKSENSAVNLARSTNMQQQRQHQSASKPNLRQSSKSIVSKGRPYSKNKVSSQSKNKL